MGNGWRRAEGKSTPRVPVAAILDVALQKAADVQRLESCKCACDCPMVESNVETSFKIPGSKATITDPDPHLHNTVKVQSRPPLENAK